MAAIQLDDKAVFNIARKIDSPQARAEYLEQVFPDDPPRRERIIDLLRVHDQDRSFLEAPPAGFEPTVDAELVTYKPGTTIGPYKLREQIGEGGMGIVYAAEQTTPVRRKVALKVIKPGRDTKEVIARFEAERQALAMMNHPNIARVLDAGSTDNGHPYFVMELVRGISITDYCDKAKLHTRGRLELFITVCQAVQHAHQKGIIHRDIKPSNILVTQHDGTPVVKVIDFGVAKALHESLTDKSVYTGFTQMLGTPKYMSPEQVELSGLDIDTRSDIYSLGVLLYTLLTGKTPLDSDDDTRRSFDELRRQIREVNPPKPSSRFSTMKDAELTTIAERRHADPQRLGRELRGDLDWIVMKALEKDRTRRYETANGFAQDIKRYMNSEPVTAVAPSTAYLLKKYVRRHRHAFATAIAIVGLLVIGTMVSAWLAIRATNAERKAVAASGEAERERDDAKLERDRAQDAQAEAEKEKQRALAAERNVRRIAYASDMNLVDRELSRGNVGRARQILSRYWPQPGTEDLRGWEWRYLWQQSQSEPHEVLCKRTSGAYLVSASHDGHFVAVSAGGTVSVWDLRTRTEITGSPFQGQCALFSPTEPLLAYWSEGGGQKSDDSRQGFRLWDLSTDKVVGVLPVAYGFDGLSFSADGRTFVVATAWWPADKDDRHRLIGWSVSNGQRVLEDDVNMVGPGSGFPFALAGDLSIAAHGTGGAANSTIRVLNLETGEDWESPPVHEGEWVESMAISPNNKLLAVGLGTVSPQIHLWDLENKGELHRLDGHFAYVKDLLFLDDRTLASASADQTVRIWDLTDLDHVPDARVLRGHENEVASLAVLPDGTTLVSGCRDGSVILWDTSMPTQREAAHFTFSSRGQWVITEDQSAMITCDRDGYVSRWTGRRYEIHHPLFDFGTVFRGGCISSDGSKIAAGRVDGVVEVWDVEAQKVIQKFKAADGPVSADAFLANGDRLQITGRNELSLWDLTREESIRDWPIAGGNRRLSPDGNVWVTFSEDGAVSLGTTSPGEEDHLPSSWPVSAPWGVSLSPEGRYLASSTYPPRRTGALDTGEVNVWDLNARTKVGTFGRFLMSAHGVSFSPDGKRLAASSGSLEAIKLWDFESQQEVLTLQANGGPLSGLRFTAGGDVVSANNEGGVVFCWRAPSLEEIEAAEARQGKR